MLSPKISIIFSIMGNEPSRVSILHSILKQLNSQTYRSFEVICVEQYDAQPYHTYMNNIVDQYLNIQHPIFNLPWCRNVGAKIAKGEKLLILDFDVLFGSDYLEYVAKVETEFSMGWDRVLYLTFSGTTKVLDTFKSKVHKREDIKNLILQLFKAENETTSGDYWADLVPSTSTGIQGISYIFNREWFLNIFGGYCEDFILWGGDDCEAMNRARVLTNHYPKLEYPVFHLHHDRSHIKNGDNGLYLEQSFKDPIQITNTLLTLGTGKNTSPTYLYRENT